MSFSDRMSNGWNITVTSFKVLKANKQLIVFPILSTLSLMLILGSFIVAIFASRDWDFRAYYSDDRVTGYLLLFLFYVVNYFIVVFFNMALIHCTKLYFEGEEVSVNAGIQFSLTRIGAILSWSVLAATVGLILKIIQENVGSLGKIITGLVGIVWSIATFFVVPIIAYEKVGPFDAVKRSVQMMREKWGESLTARFSMGLIQFAAIIAIAVPVVILFALQLPVLAIIVGVFGLFIISAVFSALKSIFISAVYNNINGSLDQHFDQQMIDELFTSRKK